MVYSLLPLEACKLLADVRGLNGHAHSPCYLFEHITGILLTKCLIRNAMVQLVNNLETEVGRLKTPPAASCAPGRRSSALAVERAAKKS